MPLKLKGFKKLLKKYSAYIIGILVLIPTSFFVWTIFLIKNDIQQYNPVVTSSEKYCIDGNFLLPSLYKIETTIPANISIEDKTTIFEKTDIFTRKICVEPTTLLKENSQYHIKLTFLGTLGLNILSNEIHPTSEPYPEIVMGPIEEKIRVNEILIYELDSTNDFLEYFVILEEKRGPCAKDDTTLLCNLKDLELEYGEKYNLSIQAEYESEVIKTFENISIETLTEVKILESSIKNGAVLLNPKIGSLQLKVNKEISDVGDITLETAAGTNIEVEIKAEKELLDIVIPESLTQNTKYILKVSGLEGTDGSQMVDTYELGFTISDGPRIQYTNISSTGFSTTGNIYLTFNQYLVSQDVRKYVQLNSATNYTYSVYGNQIIINPSATLSACAEQTLTISKGISSTYGLTSTQTYSYKFKTQCGRVTSIGTSVQGRSIYAYIYGTGAKRILFYGAIHGSEANTSSTMSEWIKELEKNYTQIPSDKTVIVIPTLNPDGVTNRSRFNANGVDLNRNFDTSDWTQGTYFQSNFYETGGGTEPFSEPETQILRNYMGSQQPYLTIAYHSAAGYVIPSTTASAISLATTYSQLSGYTYVPPDANDAFSYDITGAFDIWAGENGYTSLTVELASAYVHEFSRNVSAMWKMVEAN